MIEPGEKVWGGIHLRGGKQFRTLIVARSQKDAALLAGCSVSDFRNFWSETGNVVELEVARRTVGKLFQATTSMGVDFRAVESI